MGSVTIGLIILCVSPILARLEIFDGKCPTEQVGYMTNFNQTMFKGEWYALFTYEKTDLIDCVNMTYHWHPVERWFSIYMDRRSFATGDSASKLWMAKEQELNSNTSKFYEWIYTLSGPADLAHHYIVNTDYRNFAVVWTCLEKESTNEQNLLVLTKGNLPNKSILEILKTLLKPPFHISRLKYNEQLDERCYKGGSSTIKNRL